MLAAAGALSVCSPAIAAPHHSAAANEIRTARLLAGTISRSHFARGRRSALLGAAGRAGRLSRGKRSCRALAATDHFLVVLNTPSTWRHDRIPKGPTRKPSRLLTRAEGRLLRKAASRCAAASKTKKLRPATGGGSGYAIVAPPGGPDNDQGEGALRSVLAGTFRPITNKGSAVGLAADPQTPGVPGAAPDLRASVASDPLMFFRNSDAGIPPVTASPQEMTTATGRNVAWLTGNTSVALSTTAGQTFTMFDPSKLVPDDGRSFCCDQQVAYSPQYDVFVWVMQYWCQSSCLPTNPQTGKSGCPSGNQSNGSNRIRIAVATPEALKADASNPGAAWTYWDITPQDLGQPANAWFDRSDLSVNQLYANWSVDIVCGNKGSVLGRISLQQLLERGTVTLSYILDSAGVMRAAQGDDTSTTYFVGNNSASQARIWSWSPYSATLFLHGVNHATVPGSDSAVDGTNGSNWYDRYGIFPYAVNSATVTGNTLYVAQGAGREECTSNCGPGQTPVFKQVFAQPAIYVSQYDVNNWNLTSDQWLWNSTLAFGWPALQTDTAGDVGITFVASANNQNPQPVAGFLTPSEQFVWAEPAGMPQETGDYTYLQPGRTDQSFVFVGRTQQSDGDHWFYIEYGIGATPYVSPPSVQIISPSDNPIPSYQQGATVSYAGEATDAVDGTLTGGTLVWKEDGSQIGTGTGITHQENTPGLHTITLTATNGDGLSASSSISIRVLAPAPPGSPTVAITSPADGSYIEACQNTGSGYFATVQTNATASDPDKPPEALTYSWTDSINGGAAKQVSTQLSPSLQLDYVSNGSGDTTHDLTLTATNTSGRSNSASVRVNIFNPGCIQ